MKAKCSKCPNPRAGKGRYCLACKAAYTREWRKKPQAQIGIVEQEIQRIKAEARSMVRLALRSGQLKKLPCEVCGSADNVEGHHHDYTKPLDVKWLCRPHHTDAHHGVSQ